VGVLYAKVNGVWEPIVSAVTGEFLPLAGGEMDSGAQITWPEGGILSSSGIKLNGAAPFGGNFNSWQDGVRVFEAFPFGTEFLLGAQGNRTALRLVCPGVVSVWPNNPSLPGTSAAAVFGALANGNEPLRLLGTTAWNYIAFFNPGNTARRAYLGVMNDLDLVLHAEAGADIILRANSTETARLNGNNFLVAKTTNDVTALGTQIVSSGMTVAVTNNVATGPHFVANKVGAGIGSGHDFCHWRNNNSTIGSITRNGTTAAVLYNTTSDYRLKHDHGLITGARERIRVLRPRRVVWRDDPTVTEMDGFFAHEVAEVVPDAVTGAKDAVAEADDLDAGLTAGGIVPQQLDATRLIPLLTAALQEAHDRIDALEARLTALEAA